MKLLLIASIFIFTSAIAAAQDDCEKAVTGAESPTDLAREAALLFQEGEQELAKSLILDGNHRRAIDPQIGAKLRELVTKLDNLPGDHTDILEVFRQLVDVLEGVSSIKTYSRRELVGYRPIEAPPKLDLFSTEQKSNYLWRTTETKSRFSALGKGLFAPGSLLNKLPEKGFLNKLLKNVIGDGLFSVVKERTDQNTTVIKFTLFTLDGENQIVYKINGHRTTIHEIQETRTFILNAEPASLGAEVGFYLQMAQKYDIKDVNLKLSKRIGNRNQVTIPARIVFKIQRKHKIPIETVVAHLQTTELSDVANTGKYNQFFTASTVINGETVRMVFRKDHYNFEKLNLKTTYKSESDRDSAVEFVEDDDDK